MRVPAFWGALACAGLVSGGCAQTQQPVLDAGTQAGDMPALAVPAADEVVRAHNERVALLDRLWARAVVTLRFTDESGDGRWEQGNGHFQVRDGELLALSIGKIGEVLLWVGCDAERYWLLNRVDDDRAYFGRHSEMTAQRLQRTGLLVPPRDILQLGGLQAIDPEGAVVEVKGNGDRLVTVADDVGAWRYRFAAPPAGDIPLVIERLDLLGDVVIEARLEDPQSVRITDVSAFGVRSFGRLLVTHVPTGDSISILLDGELEDGRRRGVPRKQVFDLDVLLNAYGPFDAVIDLDAE